MRCFLVALAFALFVGCARGNGPVLDMPKLGDAEYYWIASRIFENETNGKLQYLTHWNNGEDFPSMGIGHFIWFPDGVDAPFDESFPTMLAYLKGLNDECAPVPEWLAGTESPGAPWPDKTSFDAARGTEKMQSLRSWLARSAPQQAQYIVSNFNARWNSLQMEAGDKDELTLLLQGLLSTSRGLFAVVDYSNFKGIGSNPRERYAGEGWGLVQVLGDIVLAENDDADVVAQFSEAAADRLARRVANSPPERNEGRWLEGWHRRVAAYIDSAPALSVPAENAFRVTPYIRSVSATEATITWFSESSAQGTAKFADGAGSQALVLEEPERACELAYHLAEFQDLQAARLPPYFQQATLTGLVPGDSYAIEVKQDGEVALIDLRTPRTDSSHFAVYADSETEPESSGEHVVWPSFAEPDSNERRYPANQTEGYAANLAVIAANSPDFVAIAGDLVESGGEQRDWDEFWRLNTPLAASTPIIPALGNHDYYGGPGDFGGYGVSGTARALSKFNRYFDRSPYYVFEHGPVSLIVIDGNNGIPERSDQDTNWYLDGTAPGFDASSEQWQWLEIQLAKAQREKAFTFVMFHAAPYTSGVHGRTPGTGDGENFASGLPLQVLTPLFLRYGVDAVFNGHDEMYEHSIVDGLEDTADGSQVEHTVHFYTVGIGGDGLRGPDPIAQNPQRVFLAHADSREVWRDDGVLLDGGKHYGHLDVRVSRVEDGSWTAVLRPIYLFPLMNTDGDVQSFEPREYDDEVRLENLHVH